MNTKELTPMIYNRIKDIPNGVTFKTSVSHHSCYYHKVYYEPTVDKLLVRNPPDSLYTETFGDKGRPYAKQYLDALIDEILTDGPH